MIELVLAGDGEMRRELEDYVSRNQIGDRVRLTGWIGSDQVKQEILNASALVLPSFAEGLPVVIMEAMALRRPVISTYIAGIPELVKPGQHGWLIPAGDIDALAVTLQELLAVPDTALFSMGEAARARAITRHNIEELSFQLLGLFERAHDLNP